MGPLLRRDLASVKKWKSRVLRPPGPPGMGQGVLLLGTVLRGPHSQGWGPCLQFSRHRRPVARAVFSLTKAGDLDFLSSAGRKRPLPGGRPGRTRAPFGHTAIGAGGRRGGAGLC